MSDDQPPAKKTETTSRAENNAQSDDASVNTPITPQDKDPRTSIASSPPILPPVKDISTTIENNSDETSQPNSELEVNPPPYPVTPPPKPARRKSPRVEIPSSPPAEPKSEIPHSDSAEDADDSTIPATPDPAEVKHPSSPALPSTAGQKRRAEDVDTRESAKFVRLDETEAELEGGIGGPTAGQTPTEFTKRLQRERSMMELEKSMEVSADETEMEGADDGEATGRDAVGDDSDASTIVLEAGSGQETSSLDDTVVEEERVQGSAAGD
ncbi:hypothetical protein BDV97DRAFT_345345 [Delphinella strobiligena]|nr:hypothetical protein BDV97DRAFT_345345 [Delphinella strobiligena]